MPSAASCIKPGYCAADTFAADPDIAGIGVIAAFATTSLLACFTSAYYLIWQLVKWRRATPEDKEKKDRADSKTLEAIIGSCNDQQTLTGMAYLIGAVGNVGISCDISAYHWNILANMGLMTAATFMITIAVSKRFFENRLLGVARMVLMVVVSVRLFRMTGLPYHMPDTKSINATTTLTQPAACFVQSTGGNSTFVVSQFENDTVMNMHRARYLNIAVSVMWIVCALGRLLPSFLRQAWRVTHLKRRCYGNMSMWFHVLQWPTLIFGTFNISYCLATIIKLRRYMDSTVLQGSNPENNIHSFGQYVPLVLLALLPLTVIEVAFEHYKAKRMDRPKTGIARVGWLFVLGPDSADYGDDGENVRLTENLDPFGFFGSR
ncbi:hypothetical protein LTR27_002024 [Elasticomyces elasticus]|nr:hypothetical protein LTR27_002024 [Elasticomyces elasticus]